MSETISARLFEYGGEDEDEERIVTECNRAAAAEIRARLTADGVPYDHIGWDDYDWSLEIYGVAPEWRMSEELLRYFHEGGFAKVYVNHTDKWETHYGLDHRGPFERREGWRVSYPHKRGDGGSIWTEKHVPTWPQDWFRTGYVKIKEWIKPK